MLNSQDIIGDWLKLCIQFILLMFYNLFDVVVIYLRYLLVESNVSKRINEEEKGLATANVYNKNLFQKRP